METCVALAESRVVTWSGSRRSHKVEAARAHKHTRRGAESVRAKKIKTSKTAPDDTRVCPLASPHGSFRTFPGTRLSSSCGQRGPTGRGRYCQNEPESRLEDGGGVGGPSGLMRSTGGVSLNMQLPIHLCVFVPVERTARVCESVCEWGDDAPRRGRGSIRLGSRWRVCVWRPSRCRAGRAGRGAAG